MNSILKGLLDNNLVEVEYLSVGKFPTKGLFTNNLDFMYHEDDMYFNVGDFFQSYEILRRRKITILNEDDIMSIAAFNPLSLDPKVLCQGVCQPVHDCRSEQIKKFLSSCGPIVSRGDLSLLELEEKRIFLEFYGGIIEESLTEDLIDELVEDLRYMPKSYKVADGMRYGLFFGMDIDLGSEKKSIEYAARKWLRFISAYSSLYIQELEEGSPVREAVKDMRLPDPSAFEDFQQILDFWPYVLTPRPEQLPSKV